MSKDDNREEKKRCAFRKFAAELKMSLLFNTAEPFVILDCIAYDACFIIILLLL